jgi:hypothetical protein
VNDASYKSEIKVYLLLYLIRHPDEVRVQL